MEDENFGFEEQPVDGIAQQQEDNRIRAFLSDLNNKTNDPEEMMLEIMQVLNQTVEPIPEVGKFYTFVYNAKTPGVFDEFPLVAVTFVDRWGFQGLNFHWGRSRNYTWNEIVGRLHVINNDEIDYMRSLHYANFKTK